MADIQQILKLPKKEQVEIMEAIQENLEEQSLTEEELSPEQINFIKKRVEDIDTGNYKEFSLSEVKEAISNRWNTK